VEHPVSRTVRQRRTVHVFKPAALPDGLIEELVELARHAPNHKHSEPWRFVVVRGDAVGRLADLRVELQRLRAARDGRGAGDLAALRAETADAQAVVYVVQALAGDERRRREDYASCAIAAYILQLAAWERGVGVRWNTGQLAAGEAIRGFLGLREDEDTVCCLSLGLPAEIPADWRRRPLDEVVRYIE